MTSTAAPAGRHRRALPLRPPASADLAWDDDRPPPVRWVVRPDRRDGPPPAPGPLDFSAHMRALAADIAGRCPDLAHVDPARVLWTVTASRTGSRHGLLARVTPMRFRDGRTVKRFRGVAYRAPRYTVGGREVLYLVTFCLPRFLDQPFGEKMVTVFHELYHVGQRFDGDLRRHPGRYAVHTRSKAAYDRRMADLARAYLAAGPDPAVYRFLRHDAAGLRRLWGGVTGIVVPRPKLVPVAERGRQ